MGINTKMIAMTCLPPSKKRKNNEHEFSFWCGRGEGLSTGAGQEGIKAKLQTKPQNCATISYSLYQLAVVEDGGLGGERQRDRPWSLETQNGQAGRPRAVTTGWHEAHLTEGISGNAKTVSKSRWKRLLAIMIQVYILHLTWGNNFVAFAVFKNKRKSWITLSQFHSQIELHCRASMLLY